ncbi:MAG: radical SAM/SPASM domain-containing protein [Promethearchaeota archaeon]
MILQKVANIFLSHYPRQIFNKFIGIIYHEGNIVHYSPFNLSIDITTGCNMKCHYCSTKKYRSEISFSHLSFLNIKKLLDKFNKAYYVGLCGAGETFLNPNLFIIANYASRVLRMKVLITTNGSLLSKRMNELLNSNIHVLEISLKGVNEEDYARFTGRKGAEFHSIINSIKKLSNFSNRPKLVMSYVCNRKNVNNIPKVINLAKQCGIDEMVFYNLIPNKECGNESDCLYEKDKRWVSNILKYSNKDVIKMTVKGPKFYSRDSSLRKCRMPFTTLRIGVDGGISGCSRAIVPSLKNGNAFTDNNVFNSKHFQTLRHELKDINSSLRYECFYCDLRL